MTTLLAFIGRLMIALLFIVSGAFGAFLDLCSHSTHIAVVTRFFLVSQALLHPGSSTARA